jgi:hypothetical protein
MKVCRMTVTNWTSDKGEALLQYDHEAQEMHVLVGQTDRRTLHQLAAAINDCLQTYPPPMRFIYTTGEPHARPKNPEPPFPPDPGATPGMPGL